MNFHKIFSQRLQHMIQQNAYITLHKEKIQNSYQLSQCIIYDGLLKSNDLEAKTMNQATKKLIHILMNQEDVINFSIHTKKNPTDRQCNCKFSVSIAKK